MKKKALSLVLASAMVASLVGCGSSAETETPSAAETTTTEAAATEAAATETATTEAAATEAATTDNSDKKIAMITDSGDITDESFNQITWETCVAYGEANGIETQYYKPAEDTDEERINAVDLAVAEGATVVVMPGYLFGPAIAEEQDLYPDVTFIAVDVTEGDIVNLAGESVALGSNVYICSFQEEQAGYLAGYAAVKDGYTSLGSLGGIAVPAVIRYGFGYVQGANAAAEELGITDEVTVEYAYGGQFYGDADITAAMDTWYSTNGVEVVFACGGGIYTSAAEAAAKVDGKVIGVDSDQAPIIDAYGEGMTVTSAMKGLAPTVNTLLSAIVLDDTWSDYVGKIDNLGLVSDNVEENYVQLPLESTQWNDGFTEDDYKALVADMVAGKVTVDNSIDAMPETAITVNDLGNIK